MAVRITEGIRHILVCTTQFDETVGFFRDVMGLSVAEAGVPVTDTQFTRYAVLEMPNDVTLEVVRPGDTVGHLYKAPVVSITVDDVAVAREDMAARNVEFVGPVFDTRQGWGWTYFRAPDGNLYQIQGPYKT